MLQLIEQVGLQSTEWGIDLDSTQLASLSTYAVLLADYELANVIGTKDRGTILLEHVTDALSCFVVEDLRRTTSVIDVGTGGGLPGIPLGIARPNLRVVLLEVGEKKVRFLAHVKAVLGQRNLEVLRARAEVAGKWPQYRETFALATSRALAALPVVLEYCAPFVRVGGAIIAMKGQLSDDELSRGMAASYQLGVKLREVRKVRYNAQFPQKERQLVVFDKVEHTPACFPRRVGIAKKRPLDLQ
jgi:16S rRNA (guanine527-N7)-methyltransferase